MLFLADSLDRRVDGRVLVIGLFPNMLHGAPKAAFSDRRTLGCLYRSGALARMTSDQWTDFVLYGQLQGAVETLRMKDSLTALWGVVAADPVAAWRHELPPQPPRATEWTRPQPAAFFKEHIGHVDPEVAPGLFTRAHEMALEKMMAREEQRGNKIVILDSPTRRGYESTITPEAVLHYHRLIDSLAGRPGVLLVRQSDLPPLHNDDFHDFVHLLAGGRNRTSDYVAAMLARAESG